MIGRMLPRRSLRRRPGSVAVAWHRSWCGRWCGEWTGGQAAMADAFSTPGESSTPWLDGGPPAAPIGGPRQPGPNGANGVPTGSPLDPRVTDALQLAPALTGATGQVVLADPTPVRLAVAAFVAGGHVLFEDTPGTGKTLLCK